MWKLNWKTNNCDPHTLRTNMVTVFSASQVNYPWILWISQLSNIPQLAGHVINKKSMEGPWPKGSTLKHTAKTHGMDRSTPRKIHIEPENTPLEKENHLPNHHFQVPAVNLRGSMVLDVFNYLWNFPGVGFWDVHVKSIVKSSISSGRPRTRRQHLSPGWMEPTLIPSWKKNGDHMVFYSSTAGKLKTPWRQTDVKVLVGNPNRWIPPTKKSILLDIQKTCIEIHFQCPFAHLQSPASGTRWK